MRNYFKMPESEEKVRLTVFVPPWVRTALKQKLAPTTISQSQFVANLLESVLLEEGYGPQEKKYTSLVELVEFNYETLLADTTISKQVLDQLIKGKRPDTVTALRIALALDMQESDIKNLTENQERKEDVKNSV
ncbi:hypothetical protein CYANOKiyG1_65230 [Okeania sp. KiyG1]|nr:hypothetical protein CYANOKiyG1_65230 [Okeania sp. KiyG1]